MATTEPLTEQEHQALEQMRQAQEQGSTLKELAATLGLEIRRRLVLKGAFGPLPTRQNTDAPQDKRAFPRVTLVAASIER